MNGIQMASAILLGAGAVSGWVCFLVLLKLYNRSDGLHKETNRLQEDRHLRDQQQINGMGQMIGQQHGMLQRMALELQKRGFTPPDEDPDWWKRGGRG